MDLDEEFANQLERVIRAAIRRNRNDPIHEDLALCAEWLKHIALTLDDKNAREKLQALKESDAAAAAGTADAADQEPEA